MKTSLGLLLSLSFLVGCSDRDSIWDTPAVVTAEVGLADAALLVDDAAARVVLLSVADQRLDLVPTSVATGKGFAALAATPDATAAVVLTRGDVPRVRVDDDRPRLSYVKGGATPGIVQSFPLDDPRSGLAMDPLGRYAVVYTSPNDADFVHNPNELVVVDLEAAPGAANPSPVSLRSFGGAPQRLTFTTPLALPGGPSRLLLVETDRDLGILDLGDLASGDVTVQLSSEGAVRTPAGVVFRDAEDDAPPRLALRLADESSVILVDLAKRSADGGNHAFAPVPNEVFVGGVPSEIAFVRTDAGMRLAALVPAAQKLELADPATGRTTEVALGASYDHLSLVTDIVGSSGGADVALVWSSTSTSIAFVTLGGAIGQPWRSVDTLRLSLPVSAVFDVPRPNQRRKILALSGGERFAVLDLADRTQSPIEASSASSITVSPDGKRAWLFAQGTAEIADLDLGSLHPTNVVLQSPTHAVFDIGRGDGGRALLAVHAIGDVDVTVLDGQAPSPAAAKEFLGVLLGGVR